MPAPKRPNTGPATAAAAAALQRRKLDAAAQLLREAGWLPLRPEVMDDLQGRPAEYLNAAVLVEVFPYGEPGLVVHRVRSIGRTELTVVEQIRTLRDAADSLEQAAAAGE